MCPADLRDDAGLLDVQETDAQQLPDRLLVQQLQHRVVVWQLATAISAAVVSA